MKGLLNDAAKKHRAERTEQRKNLSFPRTTNLIFLPFVMPLKRPTEYSQFSKNTLLMKIARGL